MLLFFKSQDHHIVAVQSRIKSNVATSQRLSFSGLLTFLFSLLALAQLGSLLHTILFFFCFIASFFFVRRLKSYSSLVSLTSNSASFNDSITIFSSLLLARWDFCGESTSWAVWEVENWGLWGVEKAESTWLVWIWWWKIVKKSFSRWRTRQYVSWLQFSSGSWDLTTPQNS